MAAFRAPMDKQLLKCSAQTLVFFLVMVATVASLGPLKPMPIEFAISRLSKIQQEQFVDEHNKFRSLVNPPAANMEYMVRGGLVLSRFCDNLRHASQMDTQSTPVYDFR